MPAAVTELPVHTLPLPLPDGRVQRGKGERGRGRATVTAAPAPAPLTARRALPTRCTAAAQHIRGSFRDEACIGQLASCSDVLTFEIEHVDVGAVSHVQARTGIVVEPAPRTVAVIQDKLRQREHFAAHGIPQPAFVACADAAAVAAAAASQQLGYPLLVKSRRLAYDGRGNAVVHGPDEIDAAIAALPGDAVYAEQFVPFAKELAVMVARGRDGTMVSYPVVETVQQDGICHTVIAPAQVDGAVRDRAQRLAERAVATLDGAGVFGVEMFLGHDGAPTVPRSRRRWH